MKWRKTGLYRVYIFLFSNLLFKSEFGKPIHIIKYAQFWCSDLWNEKKCCTLSTQKYAYRITWLNMSHKNQLLKYTQRLSYYHGFHTCSNSILPSIAFIFLFSDIVMGTSGFWNIYVGTLCTIWKSFKSVQVYLATFEKNSHDHHTSSCIYNGFHELVVKPKKDGDYPHCDWLTTWSKQGDFRLLLFFLQSIVERKL